MFACINQPVHFADICPVVRSFTMFSTFVQSRFAEVNEVDENHEGDQGGEDVDVEHLMTYGVSDLFVEDLADDLADLLRAQDESPSDTPKSALSEF